MKKFCLQASRSSAASPIRVKASALMACLILLSGCGLSIIEQARESVGSVASSIKNLPAAVLPREFESTAYIDRDFKIPNASLEADGDYTVVKAYFATNRFMNESSEPENMFRDRRGSSLLFGKSYITLRRSGDTIEIEPENMIKLDLVDEPQDSAILSDNQILELEDFPVELNTSISRSEDANLLIYVHGFNAGFKKAAIQSAQLSYDLGFSGTTLFFSWPARGDNIAYVADEENARRSEQGFELLIKQALANTAARKVYIVAHGMGARLASRGLAAVLREEPGYRSRLKEIILVAPDIELNEFRQELAPAIASVNAPITVYAASSDRALAVSKSFSDAKLIGENTDSILIERGVETIDAGTADTSLDGHFSYSDDNSIVADLWNLVRYNTRANSRNPLRAQYSAQGTFWKYDPQQD